MLENKSTSTLAEIFPPNKAHREPAIPADVQEDDSKEEFNVHDVHGDPSIAGT